MQTVNKKIWAVVPAAGVGQRMKSNLPKQYLPLGSSSLIETTIRKLLALDYLQGVVISLSRNDEYWSDTQLVDHPLIHIAEGGGERSDSVLNALQYLHNSLLDPSSVDDAWVLVHDAARPCVTLSKINELVNVGFENKCGTILASPVSDTIKRVDNFSQIRETVDRSVLWQAHTPQFFPLIQLKHALQYCAQNELAVTDEASAIEQLGEPVMIVEDRRDNIKVTVPEDLAWAEYILQNQKVDAR